MPKIRHSRRGVDAAISSTRIIASTSSISTSMPMRFFRPSFFSIIESSLSTNCTSAALIAFGSMSMSRFARAFDDLDDVLVGVLRRQVVDAHAARGLAPVERVQRAHDLGPGRALFRWRDGVFQVQEDEV